ncbi:cation channel sperm-associated protein subunit beta [Lacerta agilis]|uniref:cation channel sperm-associated protein subunit beta n=1 Tax=Lacerta agilis TaxID=80427 RepID=UPI001419D1BA|nr:cation channel sperm-associated protein subunit beta [Lacerta agilis]
MSSKAIKLFLSDKSLIVRCHLYNINKPDTVENRRKNLVLFTSSGLAPSIQIFNSTYSKVFYFKMTLGEGVDSWSIEIQREELTYNTDVAPIEEWLVKFNMHHGLNMFTTTGTLLDIVRDPLLQWYWSLGEDVNFNDTLSEVADIKIAKTPCASDVAVIGPIYKSRKIGVILGLTDSGFMDGDVVWYNLSATICAILENDCFGLALVDLTVTNTRLVLLTSLGLFISNDLRIKTGQLLQVHMCTSKYPCVPFPQSSNVLKTTADYVGLSFNKDKSLSQHKEHFNLYEVFGGVTVWGPHIAYIHQGPLVQYCGSKKSSFRAPIQNRLLIQTEVPQQFLAENSINLLVSGSGSPARRPGTHHCPSPQSTPVYSELNGFFNKAFKFKQQCISKSITLHPFVVVFKKQESTCFYSNETFQKWHSCLPHKMKGEGHFSRRVVSFLVDYEQNTGVALLSQQNRALVSVHKLTGGSMNKKRKFPAFWFPDKRFIPNGLYFHTNSHFLYAYGNQVWISYDGGGTFIPLFTLNAEMIIDADSCVYTQAIIFVTDSANLRQIGRSKWKQLMHLRNSLSAGQNQGALRVPKPRSLLTYAKLFPPAKGIFNMYFDHLGILNHISLNDTTDTFVKETNVDVDTLLKVKYAFDEQMKNVYEINYAVPNDQIDLAKVEHNRIWWTKRKLVTQPRPGGSCIIKEVFRTPAPPGFISSVLVDVLDRFPVESKLDSPCTENTLRILPPTGTSISYTLHLTSPGPYMFKPTDTEKTVVIPGSSSFFIVQYVDNQNALGDATMPNRVLLNTDIPPGRWFLYDFGTVTKRKWKIVVDICRYTIQQFDDLPRHAIKYLDLGSKLEFKFRVTPVNVAYNVFHDRLMYIAIGRPSLLDVNTKTYFDDNNSNLIDITVHSRFFEQGKTTISVIIASGSLRCEVTTIVLMLKSACSYLKSMHYVLSAKTSPSDWLVEDVSAEPNGSAIARLLKQLPVNYRPPSVLGIAVPLTENFYNADPSKPKLRDYFTNSKKSGRYKQCAGKSTRSECGCTENMKLSFSVAFSDCKEKALRMKFPVSRLPLYFTIEDEGRSVNLTAPYFITITEVNNRTNWKVSGRKRKNLGIHQYLSYWRGSTNKTSSTLKMKKYLEHRLNTELYNPDGLSITITGSELFHFRVSTIPGVSFCNLFDEFQIYIDDSPLAFPGNSLIGSMTAIVIGGIIFAAFLLYVFEIDIWNFLKMKLRRNKVASKPAPKRDSVNSGDSAGTS